MKRLAAWLGASVLLSGCTGQDQHLRLPPGTPVIVFSIDTLRSDRLPVYGYQEVATPAIDAFAAESLVFEHAYTHVPMTLPAHASLLSGLEPTRHGVRGNVGYRIAAAEHPWLPRLLRDAGYRTGAAVSAMVLREAAGLSASFDFYQDDIVPRRWGQLGESQRTGFETLTALRPWLEQQTAEPFFLLFHIFEPHRPFDPPMELEQRYGKTYDAEVAAADSVAAAFFALLGELDLYERSLIILLSDHGEGLGDHGDPEHGPLLYREVLQVPMIVRLPGAQQAGTRIEQPVQLIDVFPTVTQLLGLRTPETLAGRSVLGSLPQTRPVYTETYYPRIHFGWSQLTGIIEYPFHLIRGPDLELYDLERDPGETHNLVESQRAVYARLRDRVNSYAQNFTEAGDVSPEVRSQLAALGYLGTPAAGEPSMADPKAKLPVLRELGEAYGLFLDGHHESAIESYRRVLAEEPQLADAWEYLGHALAEVGAAEEALAAYRRAIELTGGAPHVVLAAAGVLMRARRFEAAKDHAATAVESFPGDAANLLARIALQEKDLDAAARHLETALQVSPDHPTYLVTRARMLLARGDTAAALTVTERVERVLEDGIDPNLVRGLFFVRGEAEAQLGNGAAAVQAFEREIRLFPRELAAYTHLALVHALRGDVAAVSTTLQRMLAANAQPRAYAEAAHTLRVLGDEASADRMIARGRARWPESNVWNQVPG